MIRPEMPIWVEGAMFCDRELDHRLLSMRERRYRVWFAGIVALATIPVLLILFIMLSAHNWSLVAIGGVMAALLISIEYMHDQTRRTLTDHARDLKSKSGNAKALLKYSVFYSCDQSMWQKIQARGTNPKREVYEWCVSNDIPAIMADWDDPMFGVIGMIISMPDEEALIFFKLKYMDQI